MTSLTLRTSTIARVGQLKKMLAEQGCRLSEQQILRECLRYALKYWRGNGDKSRRNRKYNHRFGVYKIVPFRSSEALRSVAHARCHHAGISLSRLVDFAVMTYARRLGQQWTGATPRYLEYIESKSQRKKPRNRQDHDDFVISYDAKTIANVKMQLHFAEKTVIEPWAVNKVKLFSHAIRQIQKTNVCHWP